MSKIVEAETGSNALATTERDTGQTTAPNDYLPLTGNAHLDDNFVSFWSDALPTDAKGDPDFSQATAAMFLGGVARLQVSFSTSKPMGTRRQGKTLTREDRYVPLPVTRLDVMLSATLDTSDVEVLRLLDTSKPKVWCAWHNLLSAETFFAGGYGFPFWKHDIYENPPPTDLIDVPIFPDDLSERAVLTQTYTAVNQTYTPHIETRVWRYPFDVMNAVAGSTIGNPSAPYFVRYFFERTLNYNAQSYLATRLFYSSEGGNIAGYRQPAEPDEDRRFILSAEFWRRNSDRAWTRADFIVKTALLRLSDGTLPTTIFMRWQSGAQSELRQDTATLSIHETNDDAFKYLRFDSGEAHFTSRMFSVNGNPRAFYLAFYSTPYQYQPPDVVTLVEEAFQFDTPNNDGSIIPSPNTASEQNIFAIIGHYYTDISNFRNTYFFLRDGYLTDRLQGFLPNTLRVNFYIMDGDVEVSMHTFTMQRGSTASNSDFTHYNIDLADANEVAMLYDVFDTAAGRRGSNRVDFILHNLETHHVTYPTIWSIRNPFIMPNRTALSCRVIKFHTSPAVSKITDTGGEKIKATLQGTWARGRALQPYRQE